MKIYVQIGAGAGDLDYSADFRDGFSSYVKSQTILPEDQILVVEANPKNIETLKESWRHYPQVQVFQLAISTEENHNEKGIEFFFVDEDGPHFQRASVSRTQVQNSFPDFQIRSISVPMMKMNDLLENYCMSRKIELLATDIEGLDARVICSLDLDKFTIHQISFERNYTNEMYPDLVTKLRHFGYVQAGMGMDPHNSDELWVKPINFSERVRCKYLHWKHLLWEMQIPTRHFLKTGTRIPMASRYS